MLVRMVFDNDWWTIDERPRQRWALECQARALIENDPELAAQIHKLIAAAGER